MVNKILYHANCFDGFGAAYAAWKHFGGNAEYYPMYYDQKLPEIKQGDIVYLLDYCRSPQDLINMVSWGAHVEVHDHHKSAIENWQNAKESFDWMGINSPFINFNMDKSGAVLAWERFHPGTEIPLILQHIQDRDLWKFKLEFTKEIHAALCSYKFDFEIWDRLITGVEKDKGELYDVERLDYTSYSNLIDRGLSILEYHNVLVETICEQVEIKTIAGFDVPVVNTCLLFSEVPKRMLDMFPDAKFAAYRYFRKGGIVQYGLRGRGDFDVSEVAQLFGGGGHHDAAGFELPEIAENTVSSIKV